MKAVVFYEPGGVEKLTYEEQFPQPEMKEDEVLVRVKATSINHVDVWIRKGIPAYHAPMPHIGGCEGAGIIEKVGARVTQWKIGDEVIISPGQPCFECEYCRMGEESTCVQFKLFGGHTQGAFAEYAAVPAKHVIPKPKTISFEDAAAFPLAYLTAWHMLIGRAKLRPAETVLILGASSGIGTAAIQIAKLFGARVIALSSSEEKLAQCKKLGADEAIDYGVGKSVENTSFPTHDFYEKVKELTGGRGVDVVFEHVGPATFDKSLKSLCKNGRLVFCGSTTGPEVKVDLRYIFSRQLNIMGSMLGTRNELLHVTELVALGKLKPAIHSVHPLKDVSKAETIMESRQVFGKLVIKL